MSVIACLVSRAILALAMILGVFGWMDTHSIAETTQQYLAAPIGLALGLSLAYAWGD